MKKSSHADWLKIELLTPFHSFTINSHVFFLQFESRRDSHSEMILKNLSDTTEDNNPNSTNLKQTLKETIEKKKPKELENCEKRRRNYRHHHKYMLMCRMGLCGCISRICVVLRLNRELWFWRGLRPSSIYHVCQTLYKL